MVNRDPNSLQPTPKLSMMASSGFVIRIAVFTILWLLLADWQLSSLIIGAVFVVAASLLSLNLAPSYPSMRRQTIQLFNGSAKSLSFLLYFFIQSLRGGWGIAKLALIPGSKVSPGFVKYQTDLSNDSQVFTFMQILSLLPGTVSASRDGRELCIHVLDLSSFSRSEVDDCQRRVTRLVHARKENSLSRRNS